LAREQKGAPCRRAPLAPFFETQAKQNPSTHLVKLEALIFDLHAEVSHELCHILLVFLVSPHKFLGVGEVGCWCALMDTENKHAKRLHVPRIQSSTHT